MPLPPALEPPNDASGPPDIDATGAVLERYLLSASPDPESHVTDADVHALAAARPDLIHTVDVLRASWTADMAPLDTLPTGMIPPHRRMPAAPRMSEGVSPARSSTRYTTRTATRVMLGLATMAVCVVIVAKHYLDERPATDRSRPTRTFTTAAGQITTATLDDGTQVTIAPRSTLIVQGRELALVGQVFVRAPHRTPNSGAPLTVRTGSITTRVLGTAFDVRRYTTDTATRVFVREGKVSVGASRAVTVAAGELVRVTDSTATRTEGADPSLYTTWTSGTLRFDNIPTHELLDLVSAWYGVELRLADTTYAAEPVSIQLDRQSLPEVLAMLRTVLGVRMTFNGNVVTLHHEGHLPPAPRRTTRESAASSQSEVGR